MSVSIIFLGICILLGSFFISQSLKSKSFNKISDEQFRYELISPNDSNIIIFDKKSGEYWRKHIEPNERPTDWEKQTPPISTTSK